MDDTVRRNASQQPIYKSLSRREKKLHSHVSRRVSYWYLHQKITFFLFDKETVERVATHEMGNISYFALTLWEYTG